MEEYPEINEEVVISGVGCSAPGSITLAEFKDALLSNEILLGTRWKEGERGVTNKIGICKNIEYFDPAFFSVHRQQATFMDPMQRMILERTCEALIDAGVNPQDVRGKRIGVYMGSTVGENDNLFYESIISGFGVTGHSRAMMANRVSYWLNIKGPSCSYDSNWISGIEVLQLGYDAIRLGHCEAAIIGTANLALNAELSWLYDDIGVISNDATTKAFDSDAHGYARADGVVVFYLQRAQDAKRCYATIVGTATQFNGYRDGTILDLDQKSLENFMKDFYKSCKFDPHDVEYIECYGCALKTTDEVELNAIDEVYCKNRKKPLMIGTVKPNTGHAEASANLISIAKALIAFEEGVIPATLQYSKPNPNIPGLVEGRMEVVTDNREWKGKYIAVNGIGLSSSYAHCLLKINPKEKKLCTDELPRLAIGSTRTEEGITQLLDKVKSQAFDPEYLYLIQECFKKSIPGHLYKGYSVIDKEGEIIRESDYYSGMKRPIWFVFSGMGSQWIGMGRDLLQLPICANAIHECHNILKPLGVDLIDVITTEDPTVFDNILHSFVGIAAIQIALTDVLKALGITPDGIIGHSVGELGCAYADGCFDRRQMIMCAYSRGKASLAADLIPGMMAAVGLGYEQIKDMLPESIECACHNSATSSTISGPVADMEKFVKELQDKGVFARLVNVSNIAYHSRYIKPAAPFLLEYLKKVIPEPKARSSKWISTSVPEYQWNSDLAKTCSAEYQTNNLLSSVLFEEGCKHIPKDSIVIEIAPHGLLQAILKKSMKSGCTNVPLTQRGSKNAIQFLLSAIGKMYIAGLDLNVASLYPPIEHPVSRKTPCLADLVDWEHSEKWRTGLEEKLNHLTSCKEQEVSLMNPLYKNCIGHVMDERITLALSSYLDIIIRIFSASRTIEINEVIFENIRFSKALTIPKIGSVPLYGMVHKGSGSFEVLSRDELLATGRIVLPQPTDEFMFKTYDLKCEGSIELSADDVYNEFSHRGHAYSNMFRRIKKLNISNDGSVATVSGNLSWQEYLEVMLQQNLLRQGERYQNIQVPMIIQRINVSMPNIPNQAEDVIIPYHYHTGLIHLPGLQLYNVTSTALPRNPTLTSHDTIDFIPLDSTECKNLETVFNYSISLILANFTQTLTNNIIITEIVHKQPSILEHITNVTSKYTKLTANITSVTDPKVMIVYQEDPILIVSNDELQEDTVKSIISSDAYALVRGGKNLNSFAGIKIVAHFKVDKTDYYLLRKADNKYAVMIKVKDESLMSNDLKNKSTKWSVEMLNAVDKIKSNEVLYLVSHVEPAEGVLNFVNAIRSNERMKNVHFVFMLDTKISDINTNDTIFKNIHTKGNIVTAIKNGVVGTLVHISIDFKENVKADMQLSSDAKYDCIGINSDNESLHVDSIGLGNIDYVVTGANKDRIMGLAYVDKDNYNLVTDDILKWDVPKSWSNEDACTIPHAYAIAYYALVQKGRLEKGENVLIHGACSAIGLASIAVAASYGCSIYTTVATDFQRAFLKKQFACLRDKNILSSEDTSFEPSLLAATDGVGAHVILNCVSDSLLHATVRCLAAYGRLLMLGKMDLTKNNTIGMNVFLRNTGLIGVVPEFIFDCSDEDKRELHDLVKNGIKSSIVHPIHKKVVEHQDVTNILKDLRQNNHIGKIVLKLQENLLLNQLNINKHNQFICDLRSSTLVYAESGDLWIDMVEWLVLRGARRIMVMHDKKPASVYINRRLNLLNSNFKTEITFVSNKVQSKERAAEIISQLYGLGPIQAVFMLPSMESNADADVKSMQYIETALNTSAPKALFINFIKNIGGICQRRTEAGFPSYNINWDEYLKFIEILQSLDDILSYKINNIYIKNNKVSDFDQDTPQILQKKLNQLIPSNIQEILDQDFDAPKAPELIQLPSSGPRKIRELPPVILVPGLSGHAIIKEFAFELLFPIFYTDLPNTFIPLHQLAKIFAEKIRNLHKRGPYNIVGISSGGILAIEISKILQEFAFTQVMLIDGAPDTIQASLKCLNEGANKEVYLLNRTLNINNTDILKKMGQLPNWASRIDEALLHVDTTSENKEILKRSIMLVKQNVNDLIYYENDNKLIKSGIHLIRPTGSSKFDNCGLDKYTEQVQVSLAPGDHLSIMKSEVTVDIVNEIPIPIQKPY